MDRYKNFHLVTSQSKLLAARSVSKPGKRSLFGPRKQMHRFWRGDTPPSRPIAPKSFQRCRGSQWTAAFGSGAAVELDDHPPVPGIGPGFFHYQLIGSVDWSFLTNMFLLKKHQLGRDWAGGECTIPLGSPSPFQCTALCPNLSRW